MKIIQSYSKTSLTPLHGSQGNYLLTEDIKLKGILIYEGIENKGDMRQNELSDFETKKFIVDFFPTNNESLKSLDTFYIYFSFVRKK